MLHHSFAVYAAERLVFHVEDLHLGRDWLMVSDALRIAALHDADDLLRVLDVLLLHDLVILDDIEGDIWSNDREAADLLV